LGKKLNFAIDLEELNQHIEKQEGTINQFRLENPQIDECLSKLERTEELTHEENEKLAKEINDLLSKER
jgi:cell division protein FtsL